MDEKKNDGGVFQVFPEKIWRLVVEKLDTTEDIRNIRNAFPELEDLVKGNQFSWLIGDVMPLIMSKFLTEDEIRSCRLVSKRWRNSVESSLETHPDRLPYKSTRLTHLSEHHINYSGVPPITTNLQDFIESGRASAAGGQVLNNPFPGRHVGIRVGTPYTSKKYFTNLIVALPVLRAFGHHIWYLTVSFINKKETEEFFLNMRIMLFECLHFLPNLRSLSIGRFCYKNDHASMAEQPKRFKISADLPPLVAFPFQLETLDLSNVKGYAEDIYGIFITAFGSCKGIQKLKIDSCCWKKKYAKDFSNLTEIFIRTRYEKKACAMLTHFPSPHLLRKLRIDFDWSGSLNICKLLKMLSYSPCQLESLEIEAKKISDESWKEFVLFPTIKHLKIEAGRGLGKLKFEFLEALPKLEYLTLWEYFCFENERDQRMNFDSWNSSTSESVSRFFLENRKDWDNFEGVWEEMPKLEMLTLIDRDKVTYQYVREYKGKVFESHIRNMWRVPSGF